MDANGGTPGPQNANSAFANWFPEHRQEPLPAAPVGCSISRQRSQHHLNRWDKDIVAVCGGFRGGGELTESGQNAASTNNFAGVMVAAISARQRNRSRFPLSRGLLFRFPHARTFAASRLEQAWIHVWGANGLPAWEERMTWSACRSIPAERLFRLFWTWNFSDFFSLYFLGRLCCQRAW